MESDTTYLKTPLGIAKIIGDKNGIQSISVTDDVKIPKDIIKTVPAYLQTCIDQLNEYFNGTRKEFELQLNPQGTAFQRSVWEELRTIPYGKTKTYLEQSKRLGNPKAVRAVASANGKNPIWIVIPCHRVLGTDGSLTGYAGGLWRKKWLLDHESPVRQESLF